MSGTPLDVLDIPRRSDTRRSTAPSRSPESGEAPANLDDHEPRPLFYGVRAEVEPFDADGSGVERRATDEFVAGFPKE